MSAKSKSIGFSYKRLLQKPGLCGPACVQMILLRRGLWVDQDKLAFDLGVVIRDEDKRLYEFPLEAVPRGDVRFGLRIDRFLSDQAEQVFASFGLVAKVHLVGSFGDIDDVEAFLKDHVGKVDLIANFKWKPISGESGGHYVLVSGFDEVTKKVSFCDPQMRNKGSWDVKLDKLVEAMSDQWDGRQRGFVVIKEKKL